MLGKPATCASRPADPPPLSLHHHHNHAKRSSITIHSSFIITSDRRRPVLCVWLLLHLQAAAIRASKIALDGESTVRNILDSKRIQGASLLTAASLLAGSCPAVFSASLGEQVLTGRAANDGCLFALLCFRSAMMASLIARGHETFSAFLAPPTEEIMRWQVRGGVLFLLCSCTAHVCAPRRKDIFLLVCLLKESDCALARLLTVSLSCAPAARPDHLHHCDRRPHS